MLRQGYQIRISKQVKEFLLEEGYDENDTTIKVQLKNTWKIHSQKQY